MTYNGWSNYETWSVDLIWTNDEGTYNEIVEMTRDAIDVYGLADALKTRADDLEDMDSLTDLGRQLLTAAYSEINWTELAENFWNSYRDEDAEATDPNMDDEPEGPDKDDITTTDHVHFYYHGRIVFEIDENEPHFNKALRGSLAALQFWPNVWFISDHGNAHLIDYFSGDE